MWSPCYKKGNGYASTTNAPTMCKDNVNCRTQPIQFAINAAFTNTQTYPEIIGMTKDGHMIYGPYNTKGELWACADHDVCNGTFIDGNYVYLSTTTFPYVLGCFGPAPQQEYAVTCSTASCPDSSVKPDDDSGSNLMLILIIAAVALLLMIIVTTVIVCKKKGKRAEEEKSKHPYIGNSLTPSNPSDSEGEAGAQN